MDLDNGIQCPSLGRVTFLTSAASSSQRSWGRRCAQPPCLQSPCPCQQSFRLALVVHPFLFSSLTCLTNPPAHPATQPIPISTHQSKRRAVRAQRFSRASPARPSKPGEGESWPPRAPTGRCPGIPAAATRRKMTWGLDGGSLVGPGPAGFSLLPPVASTRPSVILDHLHLHLHAASHLDSPSSHASLLIFILSSLPPPRLVPFHTVRHHSVKCLRRRFFSLRLWTALVRSIHLPACANTPPRPQTIRFLPISQPVLSHTQLDRLDIVQLTSIPSTANLDFQSPLAGRRRHPLLKTCCPSSHSLTQTPPQNANVLNHASVSSVGLLPRPPAGRSALHNCGLPRTTTL